jgi:hypothetical protein
MRLVQILVQLAGFGRVRMQNNREDCRMSRNASVETMFR